MASPPQPSAETILATAKSYLQIFATLDAAAVLAITTENYGHTMTPASMGISKNGPMSRTYFAEYMDGMRGLLRGFPVRAKEIWPNPALRQVVVWADSKTEFHEHVKDVRDGNEDEWDFRGEYIFVLFMDHSGEKVERVIEFLDSKVSEDFKGLMARALKKKAEVEGGKSGDGLGVVRTMIS